MRVVAVVQARMGSTRLPGKVLEPIGHRLLIGWTLAAVRAVPGVADVVVAITTEPGDDALVAYLAGSGARVHRGPVHDVLERVWRAVEPLRADLVVRATADDPFLDPAVVGDQVRACVEGGFDYVGIAGWPLGIAAEVARADALGIAHAEATDPADREHVMPYLYRHPERFRIGSAPPAGRVPPGRFTVDTEADLAFARAIAARLGPVETTSLDRLAAIVEAEPALLELNRDVRQRGWQEAERT